MDAFFILRAFTAGVCAASSQPGASRNPHPSSKPHFGNRYTSQAPLKTPCKGCLFRKQRRFRHNLVARVSVISVYIPSNGVPTGGCALSKAVSRAGYGLWQSQQTGSARRAVRQGSKLADRKTDVSDRRPQRTQQTEIVSVCPDDFRLCGFVCALKSRIPRGIRLRLQKNTFDKLADGEAKFPARRRVPNSQFEPWQSLLCRNRESCDFCAFCLPFQFSLGRSAAQAKVAGKRVLLWEIRFPTQKPLRSRRVRGNFAGFPNRRNRPALAILKI